MSYKVEECRVCGSRYSEYPGDKDSIEEGIYIRHLGFCDINCYNKLNDKGVTWYKYYNRFPTIDLQNVIDEYGSKPSI